MGKNIYFGGNLSCRQSRERGGACRQVAVKFKTDGKQFFVGRFGEQRTAKLNGILARLHCSIL